MQFPELEEIQGRCLFVNTGQKHSHTDTGKLRKGGVQGKLLVLSQQLVAVSEGFVNYSWLPVSD